jgi:hypothetical protein
MGKGKTVEAPANSLVYSDGNLLIVRSTESGKKRELSLVIKSKISYTGTLKSLKIIVEAQLYADPAEVTAYLYNWSTSSWDWIGKQQIDIKPTRVEFKRKSPKAYVSGSGEVRVKLYKQSDWWTTFDMGADYARFVPQAGGKPKQPDPGQTQPPPDPGQTVEPDPEQKPPDEGESLEEKAKDTWDKLKKKW